SKLARSRILPCSLVQNKSLVGIVAAAVRVDREGIHTGHAVRVAQCRLADRQVAQQQRVQIVLCERGANWEPARVLKHGADLPIANCPGEILIPSRLRRGVVRRQHIDERSRIARDRLSLASVEYVVYAREWSARSGRIGFCTQRQFFLPGK